MSYSWVEVHRYRELSGPASKLKAQGYQIVAAHLSPKAIDFHGVDYTKPTVLMMGAERDGLVYPSLRDDGEIDNPSVWYAEAREKLAKRSA